MDDESITDVACGDSDEIDEEFLPKNASKPHFPNSNELDDLIRDLNLSKSGAEILTSRLKQWNLLDDDCRATKYRNRHEEFGMYFEMSNYLCYCKDINGLFSALKLDHDSTEWRLFIDSSTLSLKAVLLHNGNKFPSLPVAHSVKKEESYDSVRELLEKIRYDEYQWSVCGDFKMIAILLGMQGGYTKHSCFLCLWDSRADEKHYKVMNWPSRDTMQPGVANVTRQPLVERGKVLLPPLHIKLGLIKQFVKALNQEGNTFQQIRHMFPKLSDAKIKAGIFVGPQVREMLKSEELEKVMTNVEKEAWIAF